MAKVRAQCSLACSCVRNLVCRVCSQGVGSISPASASPLGSVNDSSTRKLLINLILTLNNTFADYDFRDLKPEDFVRE